MRHSDEEREAVAVSRYDQACAWLKDHKQELIAFTVCNVSDSPEMLGKMLTDEEVGELLKSILIVALHIATDKTGGE